MGLNFERWLQLQVQAKKGPDRKRCALFEGFFKFTTINVILISYSYTARVPCTRLHFFRLCERQELEASVRLRLAS